MQGDLFRDENPTCDDCGDEISQARGSMIGLCPRCARKVARARRDEALDHHEVYRQQLLSSVRNRLTKRAQEQDTVTANDAHEILDEVIHERREAGLPVDESIDRRMLGAVWNGDNWEKTGNYVQSERPDQHARPVAEWRWTG